MYYVTRAITKHKGKLILTYLFGLIIVYIYTFIAYIKYSSTFAVNINTDPTVNSPKATN